MPEMVGDFLRTEITQVRADCAVKSWNSALGDAAQELFERMEGRLDWIKVRRVLRQILKRGSCAFDRLAHAGCFVGLQVVEDDDVVALEGGDQELLDIGAEQFSRHGTFDNHWGDHLVMTQGGNKGDRRPVCEGNTIDQRLAARAAAAQPGHAGVDRGLVDEH